MFFLFIYPTFFYILYVTFSGHPYLSRRPVYFKQHVNSDTSLNIRELLLKKHTLSYRIWTCTPLYKRNSLYIRRALSDSAAKITVVLVIVLGIPTLSMMPNLYALFAELSKRPTWIHLLCMHFIGLWSPYLKPCRLIWCHLYLFILLGAI